MSVRLVQGTEAVSLLADAAFRRAWDKLHARCPWATVFQSLAFVETWYRVYQARFETVLLLEQEASGALRGILPLARARLGHGWIVAGGKQAEYHCWLADPAAAPRFIEQALARLWHDARPKRLTFRYLPAGAPLDWTAAGRFAANCQVVSFACPLMVLGDGSAAARSLAKRSNRSRLKRLAGQSTYCYERLTEPAAFRAMLDDFAADCDFRHGAVHGSLPFHDDPQMRDILVALFEQTGLLDVTVTRSGDSMVGAHIGLRDRDRVYNGILVHSPFHARNSPGKLHVLQLARDLAGRGCRIFDLTPGNDPWKERFANEHETVQVLTLHGSAAACAAHRVSRTVWDLARKSLRALGTDPRAVKQTLLMRLTGQPKPGTPRPIADCALADLHHSAADAIAPNDGVARNCLPGLLLHATALGGPARRVFLRDSLMRLEHGALCYSVVKAGRLVYLLWLMPQAGSAGLVIEETLHLRDALSPAARLAVLASALQDAGTLGRDRGDDAGRLAFQALDARAEDLALLQRLGFTALGPGV